MSLHSYSSVVKRIDKRGGPLHKFLAIPRSPMELRTMNHPQDLSTAIQQGVQDLAARTARCYEAFSDPVYTRSARRANAERLRWVQTYSLREFKFCVAMQDAAAQFVANGGVASLAAASSSFAEPADPAATAAVGSAGAVAKNGSATSAHGVMTSSCFLRNTDDNTYVDEVAAAAAARAEGDCAASTAMRISSSRCGAAADAHPHEDAGRTHVHSVSAPTVHPRTEASTMGGASAAGVAGEAAAPRHPTRKGPMTREEAEVALETGDIELTDLPFDLALEMLRPQQSVLDVLVNEAALQSEQLNAWFSRFCRRRVAWRVRHEHLLHLIRPNAHPEVVCDSTDIVGLLQSAGTTVADIYAKLNVSDNELVIHLEEDPTVLTERPQAAFVSSSIDCVTRPCEKDRDHHSNLQMAPEPQASATVHSVEGHLGYVFREIVKNACVATVRWTSDVSLLVRFAVSDRWVVVDVIDHAGGITPEHMLDIWKFGWTTSEHYEGHLGGFGVGLPTSKVYMDMWGGSIDVYSTVGKGTTVRVRYPKSPVEVLVVDPFQETTAAETQVLREQTPLERQSEVL